MGSLKVADMVTATTSASGVYGMTVRQLPVKAGWASALTGEHQDSHRRVGMRVDETSRRCNSPRYSNRANLTLFVEQSYLLCSGRATSVAMIIMNSKSSTATDGVAMMCRASIVLIRQGKRSRLTAYLFLAQGSGSQVTVARVGEALPLGT